MYVVFRDNGEWGIEQGKEALAAGGPHGVGETWISFPKDPELFAIPRASVWRTKTQAKKFLGKTMAAEEKDKEDDADQEDDADKEDDADEENDGDEGNDGYGDGETKGMDRGQVLVLPELTGMRVSGKRSKGWRGKGCGLKGRRVKGWWAKGWWLVREMGGIVGRVTRVRGRPPGPRPRRTFR